MRKSSRSGSNGVLPELREAALRGVCSQCRERADSLRAVLSWRGRSVQQPFVRRASGPNPSVAAVLGIIPGVGAMYNGQYFKGLIHVVIFVVIISITTHYGLFGLFIPAWVLYQSFEAFHTAKAIRDGQPMPDPLGSERGGQLVESGWATASAGDAGKRGPTGSWTWAASSGESGGISRPYQQVPYHAVSGAVYAATAAGIRGSGHAPTAAGSSGVLEAKEPIRRVDPDWIWIAAAAEPAGISGRARDSYSVAADLYRDRRVACRPAELRIRRRYRHRDREQGGAAMNRYILIRRLRGTGDSAAAGDIALLHQAGLVEFWSLFFPLLLILIGVLKLAERAALAAAGDEDRIRVHRIRMGAAASRQLCRTAAARHIHCSCGAGLREGS